MQLVNTAESEPIKFVLISPYSLIMHEPVSFLLRSLMYREITDVPEKSFSLCS